MAMKGLRLAYITSKPFNKASIATIEKVGFQYHSLQKKKKVFQVLFDAVRF
jgi:RimJ/RimL family protein N-acetyltransferase